VAFDLWTKALKSDNLLYIVDEFELQTVEDDLLPCFKDKYPFTISQPFEVNDAGPLEFS
jgi:hypothetical protein